MSESLSNPSHGEANGSVDIPKSPLVELVGQVHQDDCMNVLRRIESNSVNVVFADPPFNLGKKYKSYNDNKPLEDYLDWTSEWIAESCRVLRDDGSLFIYNIPRLLIHTVSLLAGKLEFRHWIAWNSNARPLGKTLQPAHYGILFYTKSRDSKFYNVRAPHQKCRKCDEFLKDYGGKKHQRHYFGYQVSDVWSDIHRVRHRRKRIADHPCQLPVHLIERLLLLSTDPGDVLFDPFCGGGSAAVAAKQLNRRYIGAEIDASYAEISNQKYQEAKHVTDETGAFVSVHLGKVVSIRDIDL